MLWLLGAGALHVGGGGKSLGCYDGGGDRSIRKCLISSGLSVTWTGTIIKDGNLLSILENLCLGFTDMFSNTHFLSPTLNLVIFFSFLNFSSTLFSSKVALHINPSLDISNFLLHPTTLP